MNNKFIPKLQTTGVGSLPFTNGQEAAAFILDSGISIPFWPQLPQRCFYEKMIPQYSEGMPGVRVDTEEQRISFDNDNQPEELAEFYETFLQESPEAFPLSPEAAQGVHEFEKQAAGQTWPWVKGQVTGPITFTTGISNEQEKPLYSDPELRDAALKLLQRKAQWQIERLSRFATEGIIIFVDEPVLAAYGTSTYMYLSENNVIDMLNQIFDSILAMNAIPGIHVCGNSDWSMVSRTHVHILNFDAFQYGSTISLYPEEVKQFLDRGGCIAWGIVPTTKDIQDATLDSLTAKLSSCFNALEDKGIPQNTMRKQSLLTPSCGAGSLTPQQAEKVFRLLHEIHIACKG